MAQTKKPEVAIESILSSADIWTSSTNTVSKSIHQPAHHCMSQVTPISLTFPPGSLHKTNPRKANRRKARSEGGISTAACTTIQMSSTCKATSFNYSDQCCQSI